MPDPSGTDYADSRGITRSLAQHGCILGNYPSAQHADITSNPAYQAARRWSRWYRVLRRQELVSYEVDADGARLRFRRLAYGVTGADAWDGIAPPAAGIASGSLVAGEEYIVRGTSGGVSYAGQRYAIGERFTATTSSDYASDGDAIPWVYDGIRHAALRKGWTNEWVVVLQTHVFQPAYNSLWKPEVYADFFGWGERALFYLPGGDADFREAANTTTGFAIDSDTGEATFESELTRASWINPEAPYAYRYAYGANASSNAAFRKSCPIYEIPWEIWSCTLEFDGPQQIVVVHLRERPRSHNNAPATVDADPSTWSADDLSRLDGTHGTNPEDYRTPDNALREYLRWADGDHAAPSLKTGDHGYGSSPSPTPWGNVMPTFHLVRLIPEAYEDDNDTAESTDTRMLAEVQQQCETYLRAMVEGFVDGQTSAERTCRNAADAGLYDYTWENACYQAHGGRDCGPFPVTLRSDRPAGFGPLPNTITYAEVHNRLVGVANLLDKLRLEVPLEWQTRTLTYSGERDVTVGGSGPFCDSTTVDVYLDGETPPAATTLDSDSGWTVEGSAPTLLGSHSAGLGCNAGATSWALVTSRTDTAWSVDIAPGWTDAVPVDLRDLVTIGSLGTIAEKTELRLYYDRRDEDPRTQCDGTPGSWRWVPIEEVDNVVTCEVISPGTVSTPSAPGGDFGRHRTVTADCEYTSTHSATWAVLAYPGAYVQVPLSPLP